MNNPAGHLFFSPYLSSPPPSVFSFPLHTHFLSLSVSTSSFSLSRSPLISRRCSVTIRPFVRLVGRDLRVLTFTEDSATVKWWTLEQRQMWEIQSGIPGAATVRNRGDKSQGEGNRGVRECDLGNGFCFQEWLGFEAEHFTTDCTVRHALYPLFPLLSYSCRYRGSRSVNTAAHRSESALWIMKFPLCSPPCLRCGNMRRHHNTVWQTAKWLLTDALTAWLTITHWCTLTMLSFWQQTNTCSRVLTTLCRLKIPYKNP